VEESGRLRPDSFISAYFQKIRELRDHRPGADLAHRPANVKSFLEIPTISFLVCNDLVVMLRCIHRASSPIRKEVMAKEFDEQAERIMENWEDALDYHRDNGTLMSYYEFEAIFEDRDPFEFL
jgi:hypothetical protein